MRCRGCFEWTFEADLKNSSRSRREPYPLSMRHVSTVIGMYVKRGGQHLKMRQVEWYRDNKFVYYRLRLYSGTVFFANEQSQKPYHVHVMLAYKCIMYGF